ncbi:MAG: hypothetical protein NTZ55_04855 [Candidatus Roizmanbacteria bacterium]|nr:hypothetical protein [Candidatus Roizmanbacteria bacterium]
MKKVLNNITQWYKKLPEKKNHVEFITAVLSVPVMLTVIIINLNNLNNANRKQTTIEKTTPIQVVITGEKPNIPPANQPQTTLSPTTIPLSPTQGSCIKEVGPVAILSPRENEVVTKDPVCITLSTESTYCSVIWSYRLDNGSWSDYTDKNICLHNLTNGNKIIQLKIKSSSSSDETTLQRSFIYQGNTEITATPTASTSANL